MPAAGADVPKSAMLPIFDFFDEHRRAGARD
jgi:hypothetical protein